MEKTLLSLTNYFKNRMLLLVVLTFLIAGVAFVIITSQSAVREEAYTTSSEASTCHVTATSGSQGCATMALLNRQTSRCKGYVSLTTLKRAGYFNDRGLTPKDNCPKKEEFTSVAEKYCCGDSVGGQLIQPTPTPIDMGWIGERKVGECCPCPTGGRLFEPLPTLAYDIKPFPTSKNYEIQPIPTTGSYYDIKDISGKININFQQNRYDIQAITANLQVDGYSYSLSPIHFNNKLETTYTMGGSDGVTKIYSIYSYSIKGYGKGYDFIKIIEDKVYVVTINITLKDNITKDTVVKTQTFTVTGGSRNANFTFSI